MKFPFLNVKIFLLFLLVTSFCNFSNAQMVKKYQNDGYYSFINYTFENNIQSLGFATYRIGHFNVGLGSFYFGNITNDITNQYSIYMVLCWGPIGFSVPILKEKYFVITSDFNIHYIYKGNDQETIYKQAMPVVALNIEMPFVKVSTGYRFIENEPLLNGYYAGLSFGINLFISNKNLTKQNDYTWKYKEPKITPPPKTKYSEDISIEIPETINYLNDKTIDVKIKNKSKKHATKLISIELKSSYYFNKQSIVSFAAADERTIKIPIEEFVKLEDELDVTVLNYLGTIIEFKSKKIKIEHKPTAPAVLDFSNFSFIDKEGNENNIIDANEKSQIKFSIKNSGKGKAYNVKVLVKTEQPTKSIDYTKEYNAGDVEPGQDKLIIIPINTGENTETGTANFIISGTEANGFNPDEVSIKIETQKFINPQIKITDNIFSTQTGGEATLGIPINLKLGIQNKGQGVAKNIKIKITLPAQNVFSTGNDLIEIEELKSGEGKVIDFEFFANKKYTEKEIPVKIEVTESYGRYGENKTVSVALHQQLQQTNQVVISGIKQPELAIPVFSLIADIDKNLPSTKMINADAIAVVIGNSNYYKTKPVSYAINDAQSIKNYLIKTLGFKEGNILFKENATLGDFNTLFGTKDNQRGRLANTIKEGVSDVFIFYAGHGAPGLKDNKGYFVPVECDPNYVENSGYQLDVFYQNLAQLKAKSVTIILDACFSGTDIFENISPIVVKVKDPILLIPNAVVITSSSGTEVSTWYEEKQHGMFTYFFLKAIQDKEHSDKNKDGQLTFDEIYNYVSNKNEGVPYYARRIYGIEQTPTIMGDMKDKVFIKY